MNESTPAPSHAAGPSVSPPRPLCSRLLRLLSTAGLSFAISILLTIVFLAKVPMMRSVVFAINPLDNDWAVYFTGFALLVIFAAPLAVLVYGWRHGWLSCRMQVAVWALVIGTMFYLAYDEPVVNLPVSLDEFAPVMPGDEAGYPIIARFSKNRPEFKLDDKAPAIVANLSGNATDTDKLRQHRDEIEAGWNEIAVLRQWFADLSALPRLGDSYQNWTDPILPFSPIRTYARYACAHAELQALDGHGDEALATLRQIVDVGQKLTTTSRTLVRSMISIVIEKMATERALYVFDHADTSPAARAEFAATLSAGLSPEVGARRLIMEEYVTFWSDGFPKHHFSEMIFFESTSPSPGKKLLDLFSGLLLNPRATMNLAGGYFTDLADLAAKRDLAGMGGRDDLFNEDMSGRAPIKNIGGRFLLAQSIPAYSKIATQYWLEQDDRAALLARLKAPPAGK